MKEPFNYGSAIAALPEMPGPAPSPVDEPGIPPVNWRKGRPQALFIVGHQNGVDMVGHQGESPAGNTRRPAALGQQAAVEAVVGLTEEHLLPAIAALGDMVGKAWDNEAGDACHILSLPYSRRKCN